MRKTFPDFSNQSKFDPNANFDKLITANNVPILSSEDGEEQDIASDKLKRFSDLILDDNGFVNVANVSFDSARSILKLDSNSVVNNGDVYQLDNGDLMLKSIVKSPIDPVGSPYKIYDIVGPFHDDVYVILTSNSRYTYFTLGAQSFRMNDDGELTYLNTLDYYGSTSTITQADFDDDGRVFYVTAKKGKVSESLINIVYSLYSRMYIVNITVTSDGVLARKNGNDNVSEHNSKNAHRGGMGFLDLGDGKLLTAVYGSGSTFDKTKTGFAIEVRNQDKTSFYAPVYFSSRIMEDVVLTDDGTANCDLIEIGNGKFLMASLNVETKEIIGCIFTLDLSAKTVTVENRLTTSGTLWGGIYTGDERDFDSAIRLIKDGVSGNRCLFQFVMKTDERKTIQEVAVVGCISWNDSSWTSTFTKESCAVITPNCKDNIPPEYSKTATPNLYDESGDLTYENRIARKMRGLSFRSIGKKNSAAIVFSQAYGASSVSSEQNVVDGFTNISMIKVNLSESGAVSFSKQFFLATHTPKTLVSPKSWKNGASVVNKDDSSIALVYNTESTSANQNHIDIVAGEFSLSGKAVFLSGVGYNYANDTSGYLICEVFKRLITKDDDIIANGIQHDTGGNTPIIANYLVDDLIGDETSRRVQKCVRFRIVSSLGSFNGQGMNSVETSAQYVDISGDETVFACEGDSLGTIDNMCYAYVIGYVDLNALEFESKYRHIRSKMSKGMEFDLVISAEGFSNGSQIIHYDGLRSDDVVYVSVNYTDDVIANKDILKNWSLINQIIIGDSELTVNCFGSAPVIDLNLHFRAV